MEKTSLFFRVDEERDRGKEKNKAEDHDFLLELSFVFARFEQFNAWNCSWIKKSNEIKSLSNEFMMNVCKTLYRGYKTKT